MADIIPLSLTLDPSQANQSVGSFRSQLKAANEDLIKMQNTFGATSDEAVNAAKAVAKLKDQLGDAQKLSAAFDPDKKFQAVSTSIQAVTGGFSALTGAMALFGVQSDEVQKTLLKVQGALALSEGVNSILAASKAFGNLGTVIKATTLYQSIYNAATKAAAAIQFLFTGAVETTSVAFGVLRGAIISTGIGALIVGIGFLISKIIDWTSATDDTTAAQERLDAVLKKINETLDKHSKTIDFNTKLTEASLKKIGASEEELFNNRLNGQKQQLEALQKHNADLRVEGKLRQEDTDKELELQRAILLSQAQFEADQTQKGIEASAAAAAKHKAIDDQAAKDHKAALDKQAADDLAAAQRIGQFEFEALNTRIKNAQEASKAKAEQDAADQKAREDYYTNFQDQDTEATRKSIANAQAAVDAKKKLDKEEFDSKLAILDATSNALNELSELVGQQTVTGKILAIAAATINTFQGATKALAQGGFLGIAGAGVVIAAGLASVKKIIQTKIPGGKDAGGTPTSSIPTQAALPIQNPVVRTNTTLDASSINAVGNAAAPVRAYVIDADVQNNRERDTRLSRAARLSG